ncbi:MAG: hypothetical protein M1828_001310 [Chrysothrix sp. TS-e1954]|nr:MAG: hypothetical protein M1828_001310 [Chrysothrix sp. TS-e1954]
MGLLDWKPSEDDFALPSYDASFAPPATSSKDIDDSFSTWSFSKAQSDASRERHASPALTTTPFLTSSRSDSANSKSSASTGNTRDSSSSITKVTSVTALPSTRNSVTKVVTPTSPKERRSRMHSTQSRPLNPRRQSSFDLFGADSELQEAEPKISFCEICLKSCDVH